MLGWQYGSALFGSHAPAALVHGSKQTPLPFVVSQRCPFGHCASAVQPQLPSVLPPGRMHVGASPPQPLLPLQVHAPAGHWSLGGQSAAVAHAPQKPWVHPGVSYGQSDALRHWTHVFDAGSHRLPRKLLAQSLFVRQSTHMFVAGLQTWPVKVQSTPPPPRHPPALSCVIASGSVPSTAESTGLPLSGGVVAVSGDAALSPTELSAGGTVLSGVPLSGGGIVTPLSRATIPLSAGGALMGLVLAPLHAAKSGSAREEAATRKEKRGVLRSVNIG